MRRILFLFVLFIAFSLATYFLLMRFLFAEPMMTLQVRQFDGTPYFSLQEVNRKAGWQADIQFDKLEQTLNFDINGNRFSLLVGKSPIARNGIFLPIDATPHVDETNDEIWLPALVFRELFGIEGKLQKNGAFAVFSYQKEAYDFKETFSSPVFLAEKNDETDTLTTVDAIKRLSFMSSPIAGATLSTSDNHLPGALRSYRNGIHEGLDYYSDFSGIKIDRSTEVKSVANGVIVRIDHHYQEMTVAERNRWLAIAAKARQTPAYILDKLRGCQVWVQYENGVMVRYAHLYRVDPDLQLGENVKRGQRIGWVGNSGTSEGARGADGDLHLHMDVVMFGDLFWKHFNRNQIREVLKEVFDGA